MMNSDSPEALWHFCGIVLTIFLSALYGRIGTAGPFWQIVCRFPATLLHEMAHYVVALVTGGRPAGFTVVPVCRNCRLADGSTQREWVLGSVTLRRPGVLSALPSGLAPLGLVYLAWIAWNEWFNWFPRDIPHMLGLYCTLTLLSCSSVPSKQDLEVALSSLRGVALYSAVAAAVLLQLS